MVSGTMIGDSILSAGSAVAGGLLIALALMAAFVVLGRAVLTIRYSRAARDHGAAGQGRAPSGATL
jgi:hypothetical protein